MRCVRSASLQPRRGRKRGRKVLLWIGPGCGEGTGIFPASHNEGRKTFDGIYWFTMLLREARMSIDELAVDQEGPCAPGYPLYLSWTCAQSEKQTTGFCTRRFWRFRAGGAS